MSTSESLPPPINKRCRSCKEVKLLMDFDFSQRSKDKRKQVCKGCKERLEKKNQTCRCKDCNILTATGNLMEAVLDMIDEDPEILNTISDDFKESVICLAGALIEEDEEEGDSNNKNDS
jgi:hypothetical protein